MDIQEYEIGRYGQELAEDTKKLVDKYLSIADWDIPENDDARTVSVIITLMRKTLDEIESKWTNAD